MNSNPRTTRGRSGISQRGQDNSIDQEKERDKLQLEYARASENPRRKSTLASLANKMLGRKKIHAHEIKPLQHQCCGDVWHNFKTTEVGGASRPCTHQETNRISIARVCCKQMTSFVLLILLSWYLYVVQRRSAGVGEIFNCDPDDENSIIFHDGSAEEFTDDAVSFCQFKSTMILFSFACLAPYLMETMSVVTIIWVSSINNEVLIPIADGMYAGRDEFFDDILDTNFSKRAYACIAAFFKVPYLIYSINKNSDSKISYSLLLLEMFWKFVAFMMPDLALTAALFPVSYYVMQSSDTPEDVLVNLVAMQVFAELDDIFVKTLMRPRASVGDNIQNYVTSNPNAPVPVYSPLEAYQLNENRHEMGLKVGGDDQTMEKFHEYEGMVL